MFYIKNKFYYYGNMFGIDVGFSYDLCFIFDCVDLMLLYFKWFVLKGGCDLFVV